MGKIDLSVSYDAEHWSLQKSSDVTKKYVEKYYILGGQKESKSRILHDLHI